MNKPVPASPAQISDERKCDICNLPHSEHVVSSISGGEPRCPRSKPATYWLNAEEVVKSVYPNAHLSHPNHRNDKEEVYNGNGVIRGSWLGKDWHDARSRLEPVEAPKMSDEEFCRQRWPQWKLYEGGDGCHIAIPGVDHPHFYGNIRSNAWKSVAQWTRERDANENQ